MGVQVPLRAPIASIIRGINASLNECRLLLVSIFDALGITSPSPTQAKRRLEWGTRQLPQFRPIEGCVAFVPKDQDRRPEL